MLVDALVLKVREDERVRALSGLLAIGVNAAGSREMLGLQLVGSESEASWSGFLGWLKWRGLTYAQFERDIMSSTTAVTPTVTPSNLKTPHAAAIAGIVFSLLLATTQVMIRLAIPATPQGPGSWLSDSTRKTMFMLALNLIPFAGIAFLWFIGAVRDRMGAFEDRLFATVFLGSGLLFIAMAFVATAAAVALVASSASGTNNESFPDVWRLGRSLALTLTTTYAMRMAGVFVIATSTITLRTGFMARWLGFLGYGCAIVLLFGAGYVDWLEMLFPFWVLIVSVYVLLESPHAQPETQQASQQQA